MGDLLKYPPPRMPVTEIQEWALASMDRGVQTAYRRSVMPIYLFPDDHLNAIRFDVEWEKKPDYWLQLEFAQIPSRSWWEWHWQRGVDPDARRDSISKALRAAVIARDGYVCQICGGDVAEDDIHLDHIYPWSKGGETTLSNLRVTHSLCNIRKGAKLQ